MPLIFLISDFTACFSYKFIIDILHVQNFQSERRKQDLLAEILLEEQRSNELSKIVKELIPDAKNTAVLENPSRTGKVLFFSITC